MATNDDQALAQMLMSGPLMGCGDLAQALDRPPSTVARLLARLRVGEEAWLDAVSWTGGGRGRASNLYYLTPRGLAAAAEGQDPAVLAAHYGLGARTLRYRLPRLAHLVASRRVLLHLRRGLRASSGDAPAWRA